MNGGYAGQILLTDLSSGSSEKRPLEPKSCQHFIGGFGLNNQLFNDLASAGKDPFSPDNPIVIGAGPLIGTMAPGAARIMATTKFPMSGAVASASGSMTFGAQMKWAGYDHIVIRGQSDKPVYLYIQDDTVQICDASVLWGRDILQTTEALWDKHGPCGIIAIGPAGENRVKFSLALVDRTATIGRGGLAAVMGSKRLKAIVVKGTKGIRVAKPKEFLKTVDGLYDRANKFSQRENIVEFGMMSGWQSGLEREFPHAPEKIQILTDLYGPSVYQKFKKARRACPSCFVADKDVLELKESCGETFTTYPTSFGLIRPLSHYLSQISPEHLLEIFDQLNRQGIDLFTFVKMADLLVKVYEKGGIGEKETQGLVPTRTYEFFLQLIDLISRREGMGDLMAEGWNAVLGAFGEAAQNEVITIKGLDTIYDPRIAGLGTMEFEQIVCPRGPTSATSGSPTYLPNAPLDMFARHAERMGASKEAVARILPTAVNVNMGRLARYSEDWYAVLSSLGICNRAQNNRFYHIGLCSELYENATGMEMPPEAIMEGADRSWTLQRLLNAREGFSKKDDLVPDQWFQPLESEGKELQMMDYFRTKPLTREDLSQTLKDYYRERGWDPMTGYPSKKKLKSLGLPTT
jgi:aldehyde:ferredoxin oxidoreductase